MQTVAREIHEIVSPRTIAARIRQLASMALSNDCNALWSCSYRLARFDNDSYNSRTRTYDFAPIPTFRYVHREFCAVCIHLSGVIFFLSYFLFRRDHLTSPSGRTAILTRTTTREIKRDKGRQTWRVTYGVKCGDKNEKLRCQVIYFYAAADIFTPACLWNSVIHGQYGN